MTEGRRTGTRWLRPLVLGVMVAACVPAVGDLKPALGPTDSGAVWFATPGSLARSADSRLVPGAPVVLDGDLRFPTGPGPFPAVVLMHGCGGIGNAEGGWAPELRRIGYATFVVDSFRGRGLREVCTDALTLSGTQRIPDAYGALKILATHPKVDPRRIALMGFSHGGILTLGAATEWARDRYAPPGRPAFRAFFAFYPSCNVDYPERYRLSAPLRIHAGELDDWTPAEPCRQLVEALRAAGQDATITVYRGAHHSFDNIGRAVTRRRDVDSGADCRLRAASITGPLLDPGGLSSCLRKGATVGWNPEATEEARRNVRGQLFELLVRAGDDGDRPWFGRAAEEEPGWSA
jgi:dienelactone hydrolase